MALLEFAVTWPGENGEPDEHYTWSTSDLTVGALRQYKQWFGADYGTVNSFVGLAVNGDVDAVCCVIWTLRRNAGKQPPEPKSMDFSVGDVWQAMMGAPPVEGEPDPTVPEAEATSPPSGD